MRVCRSPELFAAYRGLPRLRVPRHPPHAFVRLTTSLHRQAEHALQVSCNSQPSTRTPLATLAASLIRSRALRALLLLKQTADVGFTSHDLPCLHFSNSDGAYRSLAPSLES